jgi:uncharacterized protein (TIGR02217 family)
MTAPPAFPALQGLGFSVIKRPIWNVGISQAASGRTTRLSYWTYPLWEWDMTWDYLPDTATSAADLKTLLGSFLSQVGPVSGFAFQDPDENSVPNQALGTGDGATQTFTFVKTYGANGFTGTEPIGVLGTISAINLNGSPTVAYTTNTATPGAQTITFNAAPGVGVAITGTFAFSYYAGFKDQSLDFEKFMYQLCSQKKITLASLRD